MTPKGYGVIIGHRDLLYDPKVTVTFVVGLTQFVTQEVMGSLEVNLTYFMTTKVNLTFDLDLKVKHLTLQVTTNVQQHFKVIRQLLCSILTEYVVSSCSFLVKLTKALL